METAEEIITQREREVIETALVFCDGIRLKQADQYDYDLKRLREAVYSLDEILDSVWQ